MLLLRIRFLLLRWIVWRLFSCWTIFLSGIRMTFHGDHRLLLGCLFLNLFFRGLLLRIGSLWLSLRTRFLLCWLGLLFLRDGFLGLLLLWDGVLRGRLLVLLLICWWRLHTGLLLHAIDDIGIMIYRFLIRFLLLHNAIFGVFHQFLGKRGIRIGLASPVQLLVSCSSISSDISRRVW